MRGFLVRLLVSALGLWLAWAIVPGVEFRGVGTLIAAAFLLGVVNAFIRPIFVLLTLPFTILTLGLFLLLINAFMVALVAALLDGFVLHGFGAAFLTAIVVSVTSWIASAFIGPSGRFEVIVVRND